MLHKLVSVLISSNSFLKESLTCFLVLQQKQPVVWKFCRVPQCSKSALDLFVAYCFPCSCTKCNCWNTATELIHCDATRAKFTQLLGKKTKQTKKTLETHLQQTAALETSWKHGLDPANKRIMGSNAFCVCFFFLLPKATLLSPTCFQWRTVMCVRWQIFTTPEEQLQFSKAERSLLKATSS